jgi:hypothetical protein
MADENTVAAPAPADATAVDNASAAQESTNAQSAPATSTDDTNTGAEPTQDSNLTSPEQVEGKTLDELATEDPEAFWHPGRVLKDDETK